MQRLEKKRHNTLQRARRTRAKIRRNSLLRPRLVITKTNKHLWLQIVDDTKGVTLVSASDKDIVGATDKSRTEIARLVGSLIAERAQEKKMAHIVFDRGAHLYHGVVKQVAEGAREGGLLF